MEKRLFDATFEGDVSALETFIQEDPLILERSLSLTSFHETPLHVAVLRGHLEFAKALLSHNPKLATESDSLGRVPLHVASAKGHVEIARELLRVGPSNACLARDRDGRIPLHVAIAKGGRVEVVTELTRACTESSRLRLERGETVFHLCVKENNLEALKVLVGELGGGSDNTKLLNAIDDDGNTVFHLAVLHKHLEIIKYLLTRPGIELNAVNKNGLTALNLIENSGRDLKGLEVLNLLLQSNNAQNTSNSRTLQPNEASNSGRNPSRPRTGSMDPSWKSFLTLSGKTHLEGFRGELFIGSAIIVTIAVLPMINMKVNPNGPLLDNVYILNTLSLVPALAIMILLLSGLSLKKEFCVWLVMQLMYTAIGFLGWNYIRAIVTNNDNRHLNNSTLVFMCVLFGLVIIVTFLNLIRLMGLVMAKIHTCVKKS
uniref:Uncharacterized protein n=2 Tax=Opuntia streptacantha TaxID=393608 RepID=A0A7C9D5I8_OPUST